MTESLVDKLDKIARAEDEVRRYFVKDVNAHKDIYVSDLVIFGALKRTLSLSAGFRTHIEDRNFTCAGALLRLQLDTALRLFGASLHKDSQAYADAILKGEPINKLKDRTGKPMTDSYLASKMSEKYPWVKRMYAELCDFIHFSNRHMFTSVSHLNTEGRTMNLIISAQDPPRPESGYYEIVDAFYETMRITSVIAAGWRMSVHNPPSMTPSAA